MANPDSSGKLSVTTLTLLNVAAVLSLRSLPGMAEYGYALVAYLALASVCFFIPSALVSAELASAWKADGGVFLWIKEAFGPRLGFLAIFMQWVENLPWFPSVLAFSASALAYVFEPSLADNKYFVVGVIWATLIVSTLLNFKDMRLSAAISSSGVVAGTIVPGVCIIGLGAIYAFSGAPLALTFSPKALLPDFDSAQQLMLLATMLVSFQGMEMTAVHVNDVENPGRNYPRAIFAACAIIVGLSVFGSLAIAVVVPASGVSLSAGVCQAFEALFASHSLAFLTPVVCLLMAYGGLTMVVTWMAGPAKGLREAAAEGFLPASWRRTNAAGMPTTILLVQTGFSCLLSLVILVMPTVSSAFMLMSSLAAQLYMVMYVLLFAAGIRLRYTRPDMARGYAIPGGKAGVWLVCGLGIATSLFVTAFGFIPPDAVRQEGALGVFGYEAFLVGGMLVFTGMPFVFSCGAGARRAAASREGLAVETASGS